MTSAAAASVFCPQHLWRWKVGLKQIKEHPDNEIHFFLAFGWNRQMFVFANLQNTSVRQHSDHFTTVISLSIAPVWTCPAAHVRHLPRNREPARSPGWAVLLTLEEPNIPRLVFKGGIDVAGDPAPVPGRQRRVTTLQMAVPDPPNVAGLKEEQLPSDHGDGVEVRLAGVRLESRKETREELNSPTHRLVVMVRLLCSHWWRSHWFPGSPEVEVEAGSSAGREGERRTDTGCPACRPRSVSAGRRRSSRRTWWRPARASAADPGRGQTHGQQPGEGPCLQGMERRWRGDESPQLA